jgi:hypothetical protein
MMQNPSLTLWSVAGLALGEEPRQPGNDPGAGSGVVMTKPTGKKVGRPVTGRDGAYTFRLPATLIARINKVTEDTAAGQVEYVSRSAIVRKALELGLQV